MQHQRIFTKTSAYPNLLHLYEHIICAAIRDFGISNNIISGRDFYLTAQTYDSGICYIQIEHSSQKHPHLFTDLNSFDFDITPLSLKLAFKRMVIEEGKEFIPSTDDEFLQELENIKSTPWQIAEHIPDPSDEVIADTVLRNTDDAEATDKHTFTLSDLGVKPSVGITEILQNYICDKYGYYAWDRTDKEFEFLSLSREIVDRDQIRQDIQEFMKSILGAPASD